MPRHPDPEIKARDIAIVTAFLAGESRSHLARSHGLSEARIKQIVADSGEDITRRVPQKRSRKLVDRRAISNLHSQIGHDINFARNKRGISVDDLAKRVNMSRQRLRAIEAGIEEATVTELVRLASQLGYDPAYLMTYRDVIGGAKAAS